MPGGIETHNYNWLSSTKAGRRDEKWPRQSEIGGFLVWFCESVVHAETLGDRCALFCGVFVGICRPCVLAVPAPTRHLHPTRRKECLTLGAQTRVPAALAALQ